MLSIFASVQFVGKTPAVPEVLPIAGGMQVFSKRGHCILLKDKIDIIQSGNKRRVKGGSYARIKDIKK